MSISYKSSAEIPSESLLIDTRTVHVNVPPHVAFVPIRRIGGDTGWYYADWLWRVRGWMDVLMGGIGFRRGRRNPDELAVGDTVDCMRVDVFEPDRRLLFVVEMKVFGLGWLEFAVEPNHNGSSIRQTAYYEPQGVIGRAYWYLIYPLHQMVFAGMIRAIAARSGATQIHETSGHGDRAPKQ